MSDLVRRLAFLLGVLCATLPAQPQHGGVLHVAQRAEPKTFNPVLALDAPSRDVLRRIHADLISIDRTTQTTVPGLAESWTISKDGKVYRLKLRKGVRFSDGEPFTADDVVFSFALYLDEKIKSPQRDLLVINGRPIECRKIDPLTVEFLLPQPYAAAERLFDSLAMLPKNILERPWRAGRFNEAWTLATPPQQIAGLGPFRLKQYHPGERVVLERNPYYWKPERPYLDSVDFQFLPDEDTQLARFTAGGVDILNRLSPQAVQFLESRGAALADLGPGLEYNFLCFNLSPGSPNLALFSQQDLRQALSLAVDRPAMARIVYRDRAAPLWGNVTPGNKLWYSADLPHPARNVGAAKQLLKKANPSGKPIAFSILVSASSAERVRMATMLQSDWKELGIEVNIVTLEFRSMLDRVLNTRQFDTCIMGLGGGDADPNSEMNVWLSSGGTHLWNPNQQHPATDWETEIDGLMHRQMITLDYKARKAIYDRVQSIVADRSPMIFLVSPHVVVAQREVGNFRPSILDHQTLWNADELYLIPGKHR